MNIRYRKALAAVSLLLVFSVTQVYVQAGLVVPKILAVNPEPNQAAGKLVTTGNKAITVNGHAAKTDATILSGATVETPKGVGATINLGPLGSIDLSPNSSVRIDFIDGQIKVTLISGCVITRANPNVTGLVVTDKGEAGKTDSNGGTIDVCNTPGGTGPVVGQGAAAAAGAGAGGGAGGAAGGAAAGGAAGAAGGISTTTGALIGGAGLAALTAAAIIVPCRRGPNPSPGTPRGRNDECRR